MSTERHGPVTAAALAEVIHSRPALRVVRSAADGRIGWRPARLDRLDGRYVAFKNWFERLLGIGLLLVLLPVMIVIGALIRIRMGS